MFPSETANGDTSISLSFVRIDGTNSKTIVPFWRIKDKKEFLGAKINVGPEYQCKIPDLIMGDDKFTKCSAQQEVMVWNPYKLSENDVNSYLKTVQAVREEYCKSTDENVVHEYEHVSKGKEEEELLFNLHRCEYDIKETINRQRNVHPPLKSLTASWSRNEEEKFNLGLQVHGKDFHKIQKLVKVVTIVGHLRQDIQFLIKASMIVLTWISDVGVSSGQRM
ncbi:hypothetical protein CEXT_546881 [Caerostris extrusa]|uniref:ELM2 domain-containing protein n=1 Tax=Caerostris extrusa TaxID=172846 RepID=A0AAV4VJI2_CAEEX|nr:hypothetical protein CEXT_546881 [Caerostris extrusa]